MIDENRLFVKEAERIEKFIAALDRSGLLYLNSLLEERLQQLEEDSDGYAKPDFKVGDVVVYPNQFGNNSTGRIVRINDKGIAVLTGDGKEWRGESVQLRKA